MLGAERSKEVVLGAPEGCDVSEDKRLATLIEPQPVTRSYPEFTKNPGSTAGVDPAEKVTLLLHKLGMPVLQLDTPLEATVTSLNT